MSIDWKQIDWKQMNTFAEAYVEGMVKELREGGVQFDETTFHTTSKLQFMIVLLHRRLASLEAKQ